MKFHPLDLIPVLMAAALALCVAGLLAAMERPAEPNGNRCHDTVLRADGWRSMQVCPHPEQTLERHLDGLWACRCVAPEPQIVTDL